MTSTAHWYGNGLKHCLSDVNVLTDTIKAAVLTSAYTPSEGGHEFFSDVSTNEASGSGYTAGGQTVTVSLAYNSSTFEVDLKIAAAVTFNPATLTGRYVVFYKSVSGSPTTSALIGYQDAGSDVSATAGPWTFTSDAAGIFSATAA